MLEKLSIRVIAAAIALGTIATTTFVATPVQAMIPAVDGSATVTRAARRIGPARSPARLSGAENRLECSWSLETAMAARPSGFTIKDGDDLTAVFIGFSEQPGIARRAVVMYIENSAIQWCNDQLALSSEPTNTTSVVWDYADRMMVVVSARADISGDLANAAANGWLRNFSDRNEGSRAAKSLVVASMDVATGVPIAATFITTRQQRSFQPADVVTSTIGFEGSGYRIETLSIEPPRGPDRSTLACDPEISGYRSTFVFPADFSTAVVAAAPGCS